MNFSRAYTSQPLCMPARATLFTGLAPRGHRVRMNGIPLDPTIPTFTEALRQAGYRTHCTGKVHLHNSGTPSGMSVEDLRAQDFPESRELWLKGGIEKLPLPYYGLESVDFCSGHGHGSFGEYLHWLTKEHPQEAELFLNKTPLEKPSPAAEFFNRNSYKWALPADLHPLSWIVDRTLDFLDQAGREGKSVRDPFLLICGIQEPHPPFAPPAPYCYHHHEEDVPVPIGREGEYEDLPPHFRQMFETSITTSGNLRQPMSETLPYAAECTAHYLGLIEMIDDQVGRILQSLKDNGLEEDTVVVFTADHGEALGDHGLWGKGPYHFDGVIRVPFLMSWKGKVNSGQVYAEPVSLLDFAPTLLDLAGVPVPMGKLPPEPETENGPPPWPGRSLKPILLDGETYPDSDALVEMDEDYLGFKMRTLVTKRHRLTVYSGKPYGELFDLENDPQELWNLWDNAEYRSLRDALRLRLLDKITSTDISLPRQLSRA